MIGLATTRELVAFTARPCGQPQLSAVAARTVGHHPVVRAAVYAAGTDRTPSHSYPFPGRDLKEYTCDRFTRLKSEQAQLLGHSRTDGGTRWTYFFRR